MCAVATSERAPRRKAQAPAELSSDESAALVGRHVAVPASFFGVGIPKTFYLGKIHSMHESRKGCAWIEYPNNEGTEYHNYVSMSKIQAWLIEDSEIGQRSWYVDPPEGEESDVDECDGRPEPEPPRSGSLSLQSVAEVLKADAKKQRWVRKRIFRCMSSMPTAAKLKIINFDRRRWEVRAPPPPPPPPSRACLRARRRCPTLSRYATASQRARRFLQAHSPWGIGWRCTALSLPPARSPAHPPPPCSVALSRALSRRHPSHRS